MNSRRPSSVQPAFRVCSRSDRLGCGRSVFDDASGSDFPGCCSAGRDDRERLPGGQNRDFLDGRSTTGLPGGSTTGPLGGRSIWGADGLLMAGSESTGRSATGGVGFFSGASACGGGVTVGGAAEGGITVGAAAGFAVSGFGRRVADGRSGRRSGAAGEGWAWGSAACPAFASGAGTTISGTVGAGGGSAAGAAGLGGVGAGVGAAGAGWCSAAISAT